MVINAIVAHVASLGAKKRNPVSPLRMMAMFGDVSTTRQGDVFSRSRNDEVFIIIKAKCPQMTELLLCLATYLQHCRSCCCCCFIDGACFQHRITPGFLHSCTANTSTAEEQQETLWC